MQIIACLTTDDEALVRKGNIYSGIDVAGRGVVVEETAAVDETLLEVEGELLRLQALFGVERAEEFGFEAGGNGIVEF